MAYEHQTRYAQLTLEKLRQSLVTRDNLIFNTRYEGNPKADGQDAESGWSRGHHWIDDLEYKVLEVRKRVDPAGHENWRNVYI